MISPSVTIILHVMVVQILQVVAHKLDVAEDVGWVEVAAATEWFSGADLQALVYSAHMEVVHATLAATREKDPEINDEGPIPYLVVGGRTTTTTRAEEQAFQERVSNL
jgi:peroxin-1